MQGEIKYSLKEGREVFGSEGEIRGLVLSVKGRTERDVGGEPKGKEVRR